MTLETVRDAWQDDIQCVVYTHLFGRLADPSPIIEFAHQRGAIVIEDCAHALGCRDDLGSIGLKGDGALFSFDILKNVTSFGGGLAVYHQGAQGRYRVDDGAPPSSIGVLKKVATGVLEDTVFAGPWLAPVSALLARPATRRAFDRIDQVLRRQTAPERTAMSHLQARVGIDQLLSLDGRLIRRRAMARRVLAALGLEDPQYGEEATPRSNAYFLVVRAAPGEDAQTIRQELLEAGIDSGIGDDIADDLSQRLATPLNGTRSWRRRAIQLPCGALFNEEQIDRLCLKLAPFGSRLVL
jgi:dTDP-4-amino-4,6-dideoxygalactose transaminase